MNTHVRVGWIASIVLGLMVSCLSCPAAASAPSGTLHSAIVICTDCKDETIGVISQESLAILDLAQLVAAMNPIPAWISGKEAPPMSEKPRCAELGLRFYEGMHGANRYRLYRTQLQNGSDLILGSVSGTAETHAAGSRKHSSAQKELHRLMNLSTSTSQELLDAYQQQSCYTVEGGAK